MKKNMKNYLGAVMCAGAMAFSSAAYADESSDAILKVLINKGIVTEAEVAEMKGKIRSDAVNEAQKEVVEEQGLEERVANLEKDTPAWLKGTKFKGDFRFRNDLQNDGPTGSDFVRQRLRLRLGMDFDIYEKVKAGFQLATGSASGPTSTNQTLDNGYDKKQIWVDQAWVTLQPIKSLSFTAGKVKNPFFRTDMLWDGDLNLEGLYGKYKRNLDANQFYMTAGYFPIEQVNYGTDNQKSISLWAGQVGMNFKFDGIKVNTGLAYYNFGGLKGNTLGISGARGTNTAYVKDWNIIVPTVKVAFKDVMSTIDLGLFGEYAKNSSVSTFNSAYRVGTWIGDGKVSKEGQWKILGQYSIVQRDAMIDAFADADFVSGRTNAKGWEIIADYALYDNVILSADYYSTKELADGVTHRILQTDLIVKF